jgi:hypothetical protein
MFRNDPAWSANGGRHIDPPGAASNDEHLAIREEEAVVDARLARLEDILSRAKLVAAGESAAITPLSAT